MKVYKLTLQEYEHLMAMRDNENISLSMTTYVLHKFRGKLKHRYNMSSQFNKIDPGSYKCYDISIVFGQDHDLTWFLLNL